MISGGVLPKVHSICRLGSLERRSPLKGMSGNQCREEIHHEQTPKTLSNTSCPRQKLTASTRSLPKPRFDSFDTRVPV
jgi:hypothetical protein